MTEQELIELCSLGESTTVQYKLEFTNQKQIAEELVAFANTRGGIIVFGAEDKKGLTATNLWLAFGVLPKREFLTT